MKCMQQTHSYHPNDWKITIVMSKQLKRWVDRTSASTKLPMPSMSTRFLPMARYVVQILKGKLCRQSVVKQRLKDLRPTIIVRNCSHYVIRLWEEVRIRAAGSSDWTKNKRTQNNLKLVEVNATLKLEPILIHATPESESSQSTLFVDGHESMRWFFLPFSFSRSARLRSTGKAESTCPNERVMHNPLIARVCWPCWFVYVKLGCNTNIDLLSLHEWGLVSNWAKMALASMNPQNLSRRKRLYFSVRENSR